MKWIVEVRSLCGRRPNILTQAGWIKCNVDGGARGDLGLAAVRVVFRDCSYEFIRCLSVYLGVQKAFYAVMRATEIAHLRGWSSIWIKCDANLLIQAFKDSNLVPWSLRLRWIRCIYLPSLMNLRISYIFKEGKPILVLILFVLLGRTFSQLLFCST